MKSSPENLTAEREGVRPRRVFVEVGTYASPVPSAGSKRFEGDDLYVGLDIHKGEVGSAKEISDRENAGQNINFMNADAENLPIKDGSVDELFFGNVFGDPDISNRSKLSFFEEANRVLKSGGRVIIKETNTPLSLSEIRDLIERAGLEVERGVNEGSKEWAKLIEQYEVGDPFKDMRDENERGYFVFLKRPADK